MKRKKLIAKVIAACIGILIIPICACVLLYLGIIESFIAGISLFTAMIITGYSIHEKETKK